jgi:hypothetical protein
VRATGFRLQWSGFSQPSGSPSVTFEILFAEPLLPTSCQAVEPIRPGRCQLQVPVSKPVTSCPHFPKSQRICSSTVTLAACPFDPISSGSLLAPIAYFTFYFYFCAGWGYIVAFTEVLTKYQIQHTWIHPLHHSLFPPPSHSWNSFSNCLIFIGR